MDKWKIERIDRTRWLVELYFNDIPKMPPRNRVRICRVVQWFYNGKRYCIERLTAEVMQAQCLPLCELYLLVECR